MFRAYVEEPSDPPAAPAANRTMVIGLVVALGAAGAGAWWVRTRRGRDASGPGAATDEAETSETSATS